MRKRAGVKPEEVVYYDAIVCPNAPSDNIVVNGKTLRIEVTEKPERGAANRGVVRLVAKTFGVNATDVEIVRGSRGKRKLLRIGKR
jgi:uncharacterized protein (TIGR00251 family)